MQLCIAKTTVTCAYTVQADSSEFHSYAHDSKMNK